MDAGTLQNGELKIEERHMPGVVNATINGEKVFLKDAANRDGGCLRACIPTGTDLKREYATYRLNEILGRPVNIPTQALRAEGLVMVIAPGAHSGLVGVNAQNIEMLALWDALIANTDRHSYNYLNDNGTIWCIDHGLTFPQPSLVGHIDCGSTDFMLRAPAGPLSARAREVLTAVTTNAWTIFSELQTLIGDEALNGMFLRAMWMLHFDKIMDLGTMTRGKWHPNAPQPIRCKRHAKVHANERDCPPSAPKVICPVHQRQHGDKRLCPPVAAPAPVADNRQQCPVHLRKHANGRICAPAAPAILDAVGRERDRFNRWACDKHGLRRWHYPWQECDGQWPRNKPNMSRRPRQCDKHAVYHTNGMAHRAPKNNWRW